MLTLSQELVAEWVVDDHEPPAVELSSQDCCRQAALLDRASVRPGARHLPRVEVERDIIRAHDIVVEEREARLHGDEARE
jgi:hypothetical protein